MRTARTVSPQVTVEHEAGPPAQPSEPIQFTGATMLTTWSDVKTALARFPLSAQREKSLSFDVPSDGPTPTTFHVLSEQLGGRARLVICLHLLPEAQAQTGAALRINSEILLGGLISFRGSIALRHILTLGRCDAAELYEALAAMADSKSRLLARLGLPTTSFATGYAD